MVRRNQEREGQELQFEKLKSLKGFVKSIVEIWKSPGSLTQRRGKATPSKPRDEIRKKKHIRDLGASSEGKGRTALNSTRYNTLKKEETEALFLSGRGRRKGAETV